MGNGSPFAGPRGRAVGELIEAVDVTFGRASRDPWMAGVELGLSLGTVHPVAAVVILEDLRAVRLRLEANHPELVRDRTIEVDELARELAELA